MMRILLTTNVSLYCSNRFILTKLELGFLIDMSMIFEMFMIRSNKWRSLYSTERSLKRVKGLKQTSQVVSRTKRVDYRHNLILTKKCSIHKQCNSKFKKREPRNEVLNSKRILNSRFVILEMVAGHIITSQLKSKHANIGHLRSLLGRNIIQQQIAGHSLV